MNPLFLGIETSCDETAAAVVAGGRSICSNVIFSQVPFHERYGGVVPELAAREHVSRLLPVVDEALRQAGVGLSALTGIGVTFGPGLIGSLMVGVETAKGLAFGAGLPLFGIHHLRAHLFANLLESDLQPPILCLLVSGGHTELVLWKAYGVYQRLGSTRDDAAGELLDKVARALDLPYPGGPQLERLAASGDPLRFAFPRALLDEPGFDFSFSGLKTAVLRALAHGAPAADVAAACQAAVVDVLVEKTRRAVAQTGERLVAIGGGVAANGLLRQRLEEAAQVDGFRLHFPPIALCTDNGAMVAAATFDAWQRNCPASLTLTAAADLPIESAG